MISVLDHLELFVENPSEDIYEAAGHTHTKAHKNTYTRVSMQKRDGNKYINISLYGQQWKL